MRAWIVTLVLVRSTYASETNISGGNSTSTSAPTTDSSEGLLSLGESVIRIGLVHALGYILTRAGLFPPPAIAGLGTFVRYVALPSLLFEGIALLDTDSLRPAVLGAVLIAKATVFCLSATLGIIATRTRWKRAGAFALFATMYVEGRK